MHRRLSLPFALALFFLAWLMPPGAAKVFPFPPGSDSRLPSFRTGTVTGVLRFGTAGNILVTVPVAGQGIITPPSSPFGSWASPKGCGRCAICVFPELQTGIPQLDINVSDVLIKDFCKVAKCPPDYFQKNYGLTPVEAEITSTSCWAVAPSDPD